MHTYMYIFIGMYLCREWSNKRKRVVVKFFNSFLLDVFKRSLCTYYNIIIDSRKDDDVQERGFTGIILIILNVISERAFLFYEYIKMYVVDTICINVLRTDYIRIFVCMLYSTLRQHRQQKLQTFQSSVHAFDTLLHLQRERDRWMQNITVYNSIM